MLNSSSDNVYVFPCSFAQQRLWFIDQLDPGNTAYNIAVAVRLRGALDIDGVDRALKDIVDRHEALRTTFTSVDGEPMQVVSPTADIELTRLDQACESSGRDQVIEAMARDHLSCSFDLAKGPLLRATLLSLANDDHVLLIEMHHIISDAWSMGIFVREMSELYQAQVARNSSASVPDLPIQYADFAVWQREHLSGPNLQRQLTYWADQLIPPPPRLRLPFDRPRRADSVRPCGKSTRLIGNDIADPVRRLSQSEGATLFMTYLAAFHALLFKYTDQADLAVGTSIANRNRDETEPLIGFFVNTLVMRADFSDPELTFRDLLQTAKQSSLEAFDHQDLPFEKLVEELNPDRAEKRPPLFDVFFSFQNAPTSTIELPELQLQLVKVDPGVAKYDLLLNLWDGPDGLSVSLAYDADLFYESTIERMLGRFETLLSSIGESPDVAVRDLKFLSSAENAIAQMSTAVDALEEDFSF